jgi:2-keto-4-pentenoate hydratase/2-oxohepta-3-ene-1,7-dioic acid hydratase in catechol pathway
MKLASYLADGKECFGVVTGDGVITMNGRLGGHYHSLRSALGWDTLAAIRKAAEGATPDHKLADIKWLPVIPNPEKVLCAGINYRSHAAETGRELPKQPSMFIRLTNTLVGHEGEMIRPSVSQQFDFEGELALVIGKGGRHIPVERAL